jgi:hypothetical protein
MITEVRVPRTEEQQSAAIECLIAMDYMRHKTCMHVDVGAVGLVRVHATAAFHFANLALSLGVEVAQ